VSSSATLRRVSPQFPQHRRRIFLIFRSTLSASGLREIQIIVVGAVGRGRAEGARAAEKPKAFPEKTPYTPQELERLRQAFTSQPSVVAYLQAQNDLMALSQACASLLSQATGLNYSASCGSSCCG
jgi:hypothetical protein